jgi:hypothetical protein
MGNINNASIQKLRHNISVSHQIINTEIQLVEKTWLIKTINKDDIIEHIEQLKKAVQISKACLNEHDIEATEL